ncbi:MAG: hypothetical protein K2Q33_00475 [Gammaproteobacteria bacterium]|nr:hypothetical protein [Gammaproteobacteria bacterium]
MGFGLADEGYLWYGAQRVLLGEIPLRDFMSYDPGRYYWSAALVSLNGQDSIMALRVSVAVFQIFGLGVGLWLIARSQKKQNFIYVLLSAVILAAWMFPRHKLFDIAISLFLMGVLTLLIESPQKKSFFITGFFVGLFAVFGRNHGVYALASSLGLLIWLSIKKSTMDIPFNWPYMTDKELYYTTESHFYGRLAGNGPFTG